MLDELLPIEMLPPEHDIPLVDIMVPTRKSIFLLSVQSRIPLFAAAFAVKTPVVAN